VHRLTFASGVAVAALLSWACSEQAGEVARSSASVRRPDILFVLIDTLRADRLGSYGNVRGLTPFLDEIARSGVVFTHAYAPSSWTCPSVASLFTSRYPSQHGATTPDARLVESEVTLAESLVAGGYATAGFVANLRLDERLGYGQGFERWRVFKQLPLVKGKVVQAHSLEWLDEQRAAAPDQPVFLYLHLTEPHSPYVPPREMRARFALPESGDERIAEAHRKLRVPRYSELSQDEIALLASLYDAEVAEVDRAVWLVFRDLRERGFFRNAVILITSDHGEEFGEHGMMAHGTTLFEAAVRIPLIIVLPGGEGRVVTDTVSLIDVAPTLLELAGLERESTYEGRSLANLLRGGSAGGVPADVLIELANLQGPDDWRRHQMALIRPPYKLLVDVDGVARRYRLDRDPEEQSPESATEVPAVATLAADLARKRRELAARTDHGVVRGILDAQTRDQLRALGYRI